MPHTTTRINAVFFNKAKRYYKISFYAFLWVILFPQVAKLLPQNAIVSVLSALLLLIPALAEFVLVPMAIINIIKSFWYKEPYNKYRTLYLIVLVIIQAALLLFLLVMVNDIRTLNSHNRASH